MTQETKQMLINRVKSLLWRMGMMTLAGVVAIVLDNLGIFHLGPVLTGALGLILGEISKMINKAIDQPLTN